MEIKSKLQERIKIGKKLLERLNQFKTEDEFFIIKREFKLWDSYNIDLLKISFVDKNISSKYEHVVIHLGNIHKHPDSFESKLNNVKHYLPLKITELESILNRLELLVLRTNHIIKNKKTERNMKKIFISHSTKDVSIVEKLVDLLEVMGVDGGSIFCSSFEGYGIKLGEDFLKRIKDELNDEILVLFVLSDNFFNSAVCLCEMGATWVKTNMHIPILIPPFSFADIKGVIPNTQGMLINDSLKLNSLKSQIESFLTIPSININTWERKRDKILKELEDELNSFDSEKKKLTKFGKTQSLILRQFKELKSRPGYILQDKWIFNNLRLKLNPKEADEMINAINDMIDKGLVTYDETRALKGLELTEKGYDEIYE